MKKVSRFLRVLLLIAALFTFLTTEASAQEELYEKSGADGLYQTVPDEARDLLRQVGVEGGQVDAGLSGEGIFQMLSGLLREKFSAPLKALASLLAIAVLCRLAGCFEEGETAQLVGIAAAGLVLLGPVLSLLSVCRLTTQAAGAFLTAAVPVYAGLLTASGDLTTGGGYSFLTMLAGAAVPVLFTGFLFPLLQIYLALSVAGAVSDMKLDGLAASLYRLGKWVLVTLVTLYVGILSVQTAVNAQVDAAAGKAIKLALSSGLPIVGGAMGDAVAAIQNSVRIVKSGVGAFGVLAALCIFAPAMIECGLWIGVCTAGKIAGELFQAGKLGALLDAVCGAVKLLLAVLGSVLTVCVASAAAVLLAKGG